VLLLLFLAVNLVFLAVIVFEGSIKAGEILRLEPWLINWAGFRRALSQAVIFW
jgi:hypothetical protein